MPGIVPLDDARAEALRRCAEREGRTVTEVALAAVDDYLRRAADDVRTDELAERGAARFAEVLRRLGA